MLMTHEGSRGQKIFLEFGTAIMVGVVDPGDYSELVQNKRCG